MAPRLDTFSPKPNRRLTLFQRGAPELWLLIETAPAVQTFCERPGYVQIGETRRLGDFWGDYGGHQEFLLSDSLPDIPFASPQGREPDVVPIRSVTSTDLAAACVWIDNWRHMLPWLVATRGRITSSLRHAVETFVTLRHTLLKIEREFTVGDPALVRAAVFGLLHWIHQRIRSTYRTLSLLTRFTAARAP